MEHNSIDNSNNFIDQIYDADTSTRKVPCGRVDDGITPRAEYDIKRLDDLLRRVSILDRGFNMLPNVQIDKIVF
jgi:hypothetical protein